MRTGTRHAHFDCQFGAAGDMLLAALLHDSSKLREWQTELSKIALPVNSYKVHIERVLRCCLSATKVQVTDLEKYEHRHKHEHGHGNGHGHEYERHGRCLRDILEIISQSGISEEAKALSEHVFQRLARAEARVHGTTIDEIHFHELGAIDALVDIMGFAIAFSLEGIQQVSCCPLPLGSGTVDTAHGQFPVPAPAVLELLREVNAPTSEQSIPFECLTPTGAAILCEVTDSWTSSPTFERIDAIGYGAGTRDTKNWPNVSRVILGQARVQPSGKEKLPAQIAYNREYISVVEANIDDQSPQALAYAVERLHAAGALDVFVVPALMKKGRSGHLLTVICRPEDELQIQELILSETTSIGVRTRQQTRLVAERFWQEVGLPEGFKVRIKLSSNQHGETLNIQPEFEDLASYASSLGISIKEAHIRAMAAFGKISRELKQGYNGEKNDH